MYFSLARIVMWGKGSIIFSLLSGLIPWMSFWIRNSVIVQFFFPAKNTSRARGWVCMVSEACCGEWGDWVWLRQRRLQTQSPNERIRFPQSKKITRHLCSLISHHIIHTYRALATSLLPPPPTSLIHMIINHLKHPSHFLSHTHNLKIVGHAIRLVNNQVDKN